MSRRLLLVLSSSALAAGGLFTTGAAMASTAAPSAPAGGACQLQGNASFVPPGLTSNSASFKYSFSGTLSNCQSNNGSPASGTESAGQTISYLGGTYPEPLATGTGSCSNSTTSGTSITQWADGDYTVVNYTTTGAGALVVLQGSVASGITLTGTLNGQPSTVTIPTNEPSTPAGASALGELTFSTASPTDVTSCAGSGLTSAVINGLIETGQQ